jgi:hypothetical protein
MAVAMINALYVVFSVLRSSIFFLADHTVLSPSSAYTVATSLRCTSSP